MIVIYFDFWRICRETLWDKCLSESYRIYIKSLESLKCLPYLKCLLSARLHKFRNWWIKYCNREMGAGGALKIYMGSTKHQLARAMNIFDRLRICRRASLNTSTHTLIGVGPRESLNCSKCSRVWTRNMKYFRWRISRVLRFPRETKTLQLYSVRCFEVTDNYCCYYYYY